MVDRTGATLFAERRSESDKLAAVADFFAHKQRREDGATIICRTLTEATESNHGGTARHLKGAAEALRSGQSVGVYRRDQAITSRQAADLLRLNRPTFVKLIDAGALEASVPGPIRRQLRLADVVAYRDQFYADCSDFIFHSSSEYRAFDEDDGLDALTEVQEERRRSLN